MQIEDLKMDERETLISQCADDRSHWIVYTDDIVMINRMEKIGAEFVEDVGVGKRYKLDKKQVSLKKKRQLSDEQRAEIAERLNKGRKEKESEE